MNVISGAGLAAAHANGRECVSPHVQNALAVAIRRVEAFGDRNLAAYAARPGFASEPFERAVLGALRIGIPEATSSAGRVKEAYACGAITDTDLRGAIDSGEAHEGVSLTELQEYLLQSGSECGNESSTCARIAADLSGLPWSDIVAERITQWAAGYLNSGDSIWASPFRNQDPLSAWLAEMAIDCSDTVLGLRTAQAQLVELPPNPQQLVALALRRLRIPQELADLYVHALMAEAVACLSPAPLQDLLGLKRKPDEFLAHLVAIRLAWELILLREYEMEGAELAWRRVLNTAKRRCVSDHAEASERLALAAQAADESARHRCIAQLIRSSACPAAVRESADTSRSVVLAPEQAAQRLQGRLAVRVYESGLDRDFSDLEAQMLDAATRCAQNVSGRPLEARPSLYVYAPITAMNRVIESNAMIRDLVDHGWLNLYAVYDDGAVMVRYQGDLHWAPTTVQDVA